MGTQDTRPRAHRKNLRSDYARPNLKCQNTQGVKMEKLLQPLRAVVDQAEGVAQQVVGIQALKLILIL